MIRVRREAPAPLRRSLSCHANLCSPPMQGVRIWAHPVFKTGRAGQPPAWKVRFLRRVVAGVRPCFLVIRLVEHIRSLRRSRPPETAGNRASLAHHAPRPLARESCADTRVSRGALRDELLESLRHPRRARHAAACAGSASGARRSLEAAGQLSVGFGWPPSGENYHGRVERLNRTSGPEGSFCPSRSALPQWIDLRQSRGRPA